MKELERPPVYYINHHSLIIRAPGDSTFTKTETLMPLCPVKDWTHEFKMNATNFKPFSIMVDTLVKAMSEYMTNEEENSTNIETVLPWLNDMRISACHMSLRADATSYYSLCHELKATTTSSLIEDLKRLDERLKSLYKIWRHYLSTSNNKSNGEIRMESRT